MKQKYNVTGMSCSACSAHVEKAVSKVPGVNSVQVNLLQKQNLEQQKLNSHLMDQLLQERFLLLMKKFSMLKRGR